MRRFLFILTTLLAIALAAASCGRDTSETSAGADPEDTVPEDTVPEDTVPDDTVPDGDGQPLGAGPYPIADVTITAFADGSDVATGITYRLACLGDTATLTGDTVALSADSMCLTLNDDGVKSRLIDGLPEEMACTMQYGGPELAVVVGTLDGQEIDTTVDRTNGCGIAEWGGLLGDLLPPPAT